MEKKTKAKPFDLDTLEEIDVAEMVVQHPEKLDPIVAADDKPWTLKIAGPNHAEVIKQRNLAVGKALRQTRTRGPVGDRPEDVTDDAFKALADRILGWNAPIMGGKPLEFAKDVALDLITTRQWFRNQVQKFVNDDASFLKGSASG